MCDRETVRFQIHERLLALDASNIELMKLVSLDLIGSDAWVEAVQEHTDKVESLQPLLKQSEAVRILDPKQR
jgi:hypothetical protein